MIKFYNWILINIGLPLAPFLVRIFIMFIGSTGRITFSKVAQLPEVIFFSIYLCVVNLNINLDRKKSFFELGVRFFIYIIIVLDCITLGMIYSNNIGSNITFFLIASASVPAIIAPLYKFYYVRLAEL